MRDIVGGFGADLVMDCSGHPSAGPEGIELLRDGGTYVEMGQFTDAGSIVTTGTASAPRTSTSSARGALPATTCRSASSSMPPTNGCTAKKRPPGSSSQAGPRWSDQELGNGAGRFRPNLSDAPEEEKRNAGTGIL